MFLVGAILFTASGSKIIIGVNDTASWASRDPAGLLANLAAVSSRRSASNGTRRDTYVSDLRAKDLPTAKDQIIQQVMLRLELILSL